MTTAQPMLMCSHLRAALAACAAALLLLLTGCAQPRAPMPEILRSPYPGPGEVIWAIAPLRNESGVSIVNELNVSDTLAGEIAQVHGISVLPVNRTLAAMRALRLPAVSTTGDAVALCRALGADALVVGSITAWNPYDPPTLGLSLALFAVGPGLNPGQASPFDPVSMQSASTDGLASAPALDPNRPSSAVGGVLDAASGETREAVRRYAAGRHDPKSALTWRRFTASMALYAKFACFEMTQRLLAAEQARLGRSGARAETVTAP